MKSFYEPVNYRLGTSLKVSKFDNEQQCPHVHLHLHNAYEIVYVKNGRGKIYVEGHQETYKDGVLVFLGPNIPHFSFGNQEKEDNFEIVIQFDESFITDKLSQFPEFSSVIQLTKITNQFLIFNKNLKDEMDVYFRMLDTLSNPDKLIGILAILVKLATSNHYKKLLNESISQRYVNYGRIKVIFTYINANYANSISTQDAARQLGLTTNSFCRLFKQITNKPFLDYLNEFRVNKAIFLLENTDYTISEITYQCGFKNPSYFSKKFRQLKKISPKIYRTLFLSGTKNKENAKK